MAKIREAAAWARALLDDSVTGPDSPPGQAAPQPAGEAENDPRYGMLVRRGAITGAELLRARAVQDRAGGSVLDILTSWESVDPEKVARALAQEHGLRYLDLNGVTPEPELLVGVNPDHAIEQRFIPVGQGPLGSVFAICDPTDPQLMPLLHAELTGPFEVAVASATGISGTLSRSFVKSAEHNATAKLRETSPQDSASVVATRPQLITAAMILFLLVAGLLLFTVPTLIVINALAAAFYLSSSIFRVRLIQLATSPAAHASANAAAPPLMDEKDLPTYTILVPLYHEAAMVGALVKSLGRLDYPAHKLDVLMICEGDDAETIDAIVSMELGTQFRLIVVPHSLPKTKPKACNYALRYARGDFAVIFDAEDDPEPDQLRRVLATFQTASENVACVQARLGYRNAEQNLLTRWFTVEYMMWFDLILPGLERIDAPIPLGGTSNHFRIGVLRDLDGWDPFNVTEDADLGIRLYKRGYKTLNIASTTYEEANSRVGNWIRQRSRWMKGHMQTWLVHNRNPARTRRELGWRGWISFQLTIGASPLAALLNPIFWALLVLWFLTHLGLLREMLPGFVFYVASINLLVWNFVFVYASAVGVARRNATELVRYALLSPIYWVLISVATWKGAWQLITRPFYWEKTVHGLDGP